MESSKVIIGGKETPSAVRPVDPRRAWNTLGGLGVLIVLGGLVDLTVGLMPLRLDEPAWRFGVGIGAIGSWPLFVLGTTMVVMAGVGSGLVGLLRIGVTVSLVLFVALGLALGLVVAARGPTMAAAQLELHDSMNRSYVKAVVTGTIYLLILALGLRTALAALRSGSDV